MVPEAGDFFIGDFRMTIGEDRHKVANIVTPNLHLFRELYHDVLVNEEHLLWDKTSGTLEQIPNFATRWVVAQKTNPLLTAFV